MARINLRMPDHLKARVEQAAVGEGLSVNSWLVRAASAALDRGGTGPRGQRRPVMGAQRYTGWARQRTRRAGPPSADRRDAANPTDQDRH